MLGAMVNSMVMGLNHIIIRKTGKTMTYVSMDGQKDPYDNRKYKAPKGWTNREIQLTHSKAYMLVGDENSHKKAVYHLHGGGYMGVMSENDYGISLKYASYFKGADTFDLDYRVAPKYRYPAALEDAVEGYRYLITNGYEPGRIMVTGDSAGGGLALAMCLYLRDHGEPMPLMLCLASPWADLTATGKSYRTNIKSDAIFGSIREEDAPQYPVPVDYAGDSDKTDPYISPVFGEYEGMPPMLIQASADELLLSDSIQTVERAKAAGVDAECITYPKMLHTFYVLLKNCKEGKQAWARVEEFIRRYDA